MALEGLQLGQYRLLRLIGSGGMGEVYLAEDARINQQVAIKISRTEGSAYPNSDTAKDAVRLFQREARAIAKLDHPRILPLFTYGEQNVNGMTLTYIVMPFRHEGSFADWLQQRSSSDLLPAQDIAYFLSQAADALQYAHDNQIVHQDVKPSNFLIRANKEHPNQPDLLLTDFGIAKLSTATASISHSIRGTPTYMAPEQWSGDPVPATDQYALAVLIYELLAGRPPFQGRQEQVMYQHFNVQPQPPCTFNPLIPKDIDTVILQALSKKPEERFLSISAFARAFQQAAQSSNAPTEIVRPSYPGNSDKTFLASQSRSTGETAIPLGTGSIEKTVAVPNPPAFVPNGEVIYQPPSRGQGTSKGKVLLLVGLALLVLIASIGVTSGAYFYFQRSNQPIINNSDTTATAQAHDAMATSQSVKATATSQTLNTNATTAAANSNPYPPYSGTLALRDSLSDNSQGYNWDLKPTQFGTCTFTGGGYQVVTPSISTYHSCAARNTNFSNFTYEIALTIVTGDCGGIIFRGDFPAHHYYIFGICQDGSYRLRLYTQIEGPETQTFVQSSSPSIHAGLGQSNLIAVVAVNDSLSLYVNHQFVTSVHDSTYSQGQIGVAADNDNSPTEVVFSNVKVWRM